MKTNDFSIENISETATDLQAGLFVLELEERLEMAALTAAVASSQRCDIEIDAL